MFISDLQIGDQVEGFYILQNATAKTTMSGKPFLSMVWAMLLEALMLRFGTTQVLSRQRTQARLSRFVELYRITKARSRLL